MSCTGWRVLRNVAARSYAEYVSERIHAGASCCVKNRKCNASLFHRPCGRRSPKKNCNGKQLVERLTDASFVHVKAEGGSFGVRAKTLFDAVGGWLQCVYNLARTFCAVANGLAALLQIRFTVDPLLPDASVDARNGCVSNTTHYSRTFFTRYTHKKNYTKRFWLKQYRLCNYTT